MSQAKPQKKSSGFPWAIVVMVIALVVSILVYKFVFGDVSHFLDAERKEPKPGDFLGIIYKGGPIVPILMSMFLLVITFSIERALTIMRAKGAGSLEGFLQKTKTLLHNKDINGAISECNRQKGAVANVVVDLGLQRTG